MKHILLTILMILIAGAAGAAYAAQAVAPAQPITSGQALADVLQNSVLPIVGSLFLSMLTVCLKRISEKYKINNLADKNGLLMQVAQQAVQWVEEHAAHFVGKPGELSSSQKLNMAISHVLQYVPKVTDVQAEKAVKAVLATIPGMGATNDVVAVPSTSGFITGTALISGAEAPPDVPSSQELVEANAAVASATVALEIANQRLAAVQGNN